MNVVTCYELNSELRHRIESVIAPARLIESEQSSIAKDILQADVFCGHAKVAIDWNEVVQRGRLKWIQSSASGLDHCLVPAVRESDIVVSGACGLFAQAVAEQTMALLFGLLRQLPVFFRAALQKEYVRRPTADLFDKTVGLVGFGGNGQRIAEFLSGSGCRIMATDPLGEEWRVARTLPKIESLWPADQLDRMLAESDIVILTLPLNDRTRGLFDRHRISRMRPGSYLVNVARGPIVRESDLVASLESGQLAGAALDVAEIEPLPTHSRLWDMPNILITPHVGAQSSHRYELVTDLFCENFTRFRDDRRLKNRVDKKLGFSRPQDRS